jgi:hypothetical protein
MNNKRLRPSCHLRNTCVQSPFCVCSWPTANSTGIGGGVPYLAGAGDGGVGVYAAVGGVYSPMFSDRIIEASRMTTDQTTNRD